MQAVQGYYDGTGIQLLEKVQAKPNQRAIVTIMDEFVAPEKTTAQKNLHGAPAQYTSAQRSIADALAMPEATDIEFDPPRLVIASRPADLA